MSNTKLSLICILSLLIKFPLVNGAVEDEEEWARLYGTHQKYSGVWPLARYLRENLEELKLFCTKAHKQWTKTNETIMEAYVNHWEITFDDRRIKPIWADIITYAEDRERVQPEILFYHFVMKGNRPDCVFYMDRVRREGEERVEMLFRDHVCGITGVEKFIH